MLHNLKDMEHYSIGARDGVIGRVSDLYFDDLAWVIRYLVVTFNDMQPHRKVLISPISIGTPNWSEGIFPVALSQEQIRNSPDIDTDKPVSRQQEMGYFGYYGYGSYWGGGGLWGAGMYPDVLQGGLQLPTAVAKSRTADRHDHHDDPHLRSSNAVMRYYVHASDGDLGHVAGFLVDEKSWAIRYIIVDTSNWWLGHKVILSPEWISEVSWADSLVSFDLTRDAIKQAPPYDSTVPLTRDGEFGIQRHYGRKSRWPRSGDSAAA